MTERKNIQYRLDTVIRDIIKLRDRVCFTCGQQRPLTVGHFIKRRHTATRWDLMNVHGQCWECNSRDDFNEYHEAMLRCYPEKAVNELIATSRLNIKFTTYELKEMYYNLLDWKMNYETDKEKE